MTPPPAALREIAAEVARLLPCWRDPERYFEARSALAERLRRLAREIERER